MRKLSVADRAKKKAALDKKRAAARASAAAIPPPLNPVQAVLRAASFAARKHHGQTRADNQTPYFSHVARVTLILTHVFGCDDEEVLTAALLHDTIEDTATDYDEIAELFGTQVADYVVTLTKNVMLPKQEREEDYAFAEAAQDRRDRREAARGLRRKARNADRPVGARQVVRAPGRGEAVATGGDPAREPVDRARLSIHEQRSRASLGE